jgi:hypothetical protein
MYYEVYDCLQSNKNNPIDSKLLQQYLNKSFIDSFFEGRSYVDENQYNKKEDLKRLIENCYPFILVQRIISGIAKSVWLGFDPSVLSIDSLDSTGRLKVPHTSMFFNLESPCVYLRSAPGSELNYSETSLCEWENIFLACAEKIENEIGVQPKKEGFRSNLVRTLEGIYSLHSTHPRRCAWVRFLYEIVMSGNSVNLAEFEKKHNIKFIVKKYDQGFILTINEHEVYPYLEFNWMKQIKTIDTSSGLSELVNEVSDFNDSFEVYSAINKFLIGKLPLCHFYINEHMFVAKEEHSFNNYYDFFVKGWKQEGEYCVHFLANETTKLESLPIDKFALKLKEMKYSIILGMSSVTKKKESFFLSRPYMVKDLSLA